MDYAGFILRRERLERNWSQEGLCGGLCTVSYLSKIEQGKADPSPELLKSIMAQMDIMWHDADSEMTAFIDRAWESLLSLDENFPHMQEGTDDKRYLFSPLGPDYLLLKALSGDAPVPLDESLEICLDMRQLAFQRFLQKRYDEALRLYPCPWLYTMAGRAYYVNGDVPAALEMLEKGYQTAADEGYPRVMLLCRLYMGNCCSNRHDLAAMQRHYRIAGRIAEAVNDLSSLETIRYNTAATQLEAGRFSEALAYFESVPEPSRMDLHKLAVCHEKLGNIPCAIDAIERAKCAPPCEWMPGKLDEKMLDLVAYRLAHPEYLQDASYGEMLTELFDGLKSRLPFGYAAFHLPWMLEWYESNRQYRSAYRLMRDFPDTGKTGGFNS